MMQNYRTPLLSLIVAFVLGGCAVQGEHYAGDVIGGPEASAQRDDGAKTSRDPLLDAPYRAEMTCSTERPVTVLQRIKEVPFACPDVGVSATVDELRDAGWRLLALNIGEDQEYDNHVGFVVTIDVRKLF